MWGAVQAVEIADAARVKWTDVIGKRRHRHLVELRARIVKHLRAMTDLSLPEIGSVIHREHTSVLYLLRRP